MKVLLSLQLQLSHDFYYLFIYLLVCKSHFGVHNICVNYFATALETFVEKRITGFPVIDDDWRLVSLMQFHGSLRFADIMVSNVIMIYHVTI